MRDGTHEIPLPAPEMTRTGNKRYPLIEAAQLDTKPALMRAAHIGANGAGGNFAPVRMRPPDSTKTDV